MSRIRTALGAAMSHLETADVTAATAAIQRALGIDRRAGRAEPAPERRVDTDAAPAGETRPRRSLADVVEALHGLRARFAGPTDVAMPTPDVGSDLDPRFTRHHFVCDAGALSYKLYVPARLPPGRASLVMMLHGCTQDPDDFARGTRMNALADDDGLIVVYPQQSRGANANGCWNWFDAGHQRRGAGEPAVLAGLARQIAADHGIDRAHTFVAGLSAGGAMAEVLAATYPDVFAAAGIHSGLPYGAAVDLVSAFAAMKGHGARGPSRTRDAGGPDVRKIVFHGDADTTVHASNARAILDRATADGAGADHRIADRTIDGRRVTHTTVGDADGGAHTEHWLIHGGGHAWSGGAPAGSYTDPVGPDASREMVRFFLRR